MGADLGLDLGFHGQPPWCGSQYTNELCQSHCHTGYPIRPLLGCFFAPYFKALVLPANSKPPPLHEEQATVSSTWKEPDFPVTLSTLLLDKLLCPGARRHTIPPPPRGQAPFSGTLLPMFCLLSASLLPS